MVDNVSVGAVTDYTFTTVIADHTITAAFAIDTYEITVTQGANGAIAPAGTAGVVSVTGLTDQAFTIDPDAGYYIADVTVDGVSVGAVTDYTFTDVIADHTITAAFAIDTYEITVTQGANGTIAPAGPGAVSVTGLTDQAFTIDPDAGYYIADVTVDGVSVGAVTDYTFTDVIADHTITAAFAIDTYEITVTQGANGAIAPAGRWGGQRHRPDRPGLHHRPRCRLLHRRRDRGRRQRRRGHRLHLHRRDRRPHHHRGLRHRHLRDHRDPGRQRRHRPGRTAGVVSVTGLIDQAFTIDPDAGYYIADVTVDGVSVGAVTDYTFTDVIADHTITAAFAIDTYEITVTQAANGAIAPAGTAGVVSVTGLIDQAFAIAADAGYYITDVTVDGVSVGAVTDYTFTDVIADHTITAAFAIDTYEITVTQGANGAITPAGTAGVVSVTGLTDQAFTIDPDDGYYITDVTVDGVQRRRGRLDYTFTRVIAATTPSPRPSPSTPTRSP